MQQEAEIAVIDGISNVELFIFTLNIFYEFSNKYLIYLKLCNILYIFLIFKSWKDKFLFFCPFLW